MGLLDEAIREHLELKRQHGADPEELARQERAALAPPDAAEPRTTEPPLDDHELVFDDDQDADDEGSLGAEESSRPDSSSAIQETAEIDMRTVLEGIDAEDDELREMSGRDARGPHAAPAAARIEPPSSTPALDADPLDWDAPATRGRLFKRRRVRARASEGELPTEGSLP